MAPGIFNAPCQRCLPAANTAGVNVNEIRFFIISDSSQLEFQGGIPQLTGIQPPQPDVDGFPEEVLAVLGDTLALAAKLPVGLFRPVR